MFLSLVDRVSGGSVLFLCFIQYVCRIWRALSLRISFPVILRYVDEALSFFKTAVARQATEFVNLSSLVTAFAVSREYLLRSL